MNGYLADVSGSDDESSKEVRIVNSRRSTIGAKAKAKTGSGSSKRSRKRRAPASMTLKEALKSPIHPEINYQLTKHVFSKDFPEETKTMIDVETSRAMQSDIKQRLPISTASAEIGPLASLAEEETPISSELPQTSTLIPCERRTTTFSKRHRRLEEGLALTQIPRYVSTVVDSKPPLSFSKIIFFVTSLLIEAEPPHRVVHANAAFTQTIIGTSSNIQRWFVRQSCPEIPKTRNLKEALHDIIPNRDVDLVVYPVDGHEKVSHYLIETKDDSRKKRRRIKHDEPHRAIG